MNDSPEALLERFYRDKLRTSLTELNEQLLILIARAGKSCPGCQGVGVQFGRNLARPDGKQVYCKQCRKERRVHNNRGAGGIQEKLQSTSESSSSEAENG